ncbi:glycosyltransferase [Rosistilla oblonga]|uniref:glycosyltransferase n=1 Tax=Rosistilla oblonga TaxID=2527990 RepID=UPI003A984371
MPDISIAMSTYNGERFILEQLESLANQSRLPKELVIGDDQSTDKTVAIIKSFANTAPFPVSITVNEQNLGFERNFLETASRCSGEWIAFCDQDDVWLPNRISEAAAEIALGDKDLMLVIQAAELVDANLNRTGRRLPNIRRRRIVPRNGHYGFWVAVGFAQTVRAELIFRYDWTNRPTNEHPGFGLQSHDKWSCMLANALGSTAYLPNVAAWYRRHDSTVTGDFTHRSYASRFTTAAATGSEDYKRLGDIALESQQTITELANGEVDKQLRSRLFEAANQYAQMAKIQSNRSIIYQSNFAVERLSKLHENIRRGAYFGNPFVSRGLKSLLKDTTFALTRTQMPRHLGNVSLRD